MSTMIRSELYRMATIRSSWVSLALFGFLAAAFGILEPYAWALFAGFGAFGISVLTITQHYQHRTAALLYLAQPKRVRVLLAQVLTTIIVATGLSAISGITVLAQGNHSYYQQTLTVVPIMAVFGSALAAIVRRSSWLLIGFAAWFVLVETLAGKLEWQLPISSYLAAASGKGDAFSLEIFIVWAVAALSVAVLTLHRDVNVD
jgi:hypothetical protein